MDKELKKAYIALAIVSLVWGTTYLASRISALQIPGLFVSGMRQFISGLILVGYFKARGFSWPDKAAFTKIFIQGILLLCISNGLSTWSVQYISSGLASIISALVPLFIAFFSICFFKATRFTLQILIGVCIGFLGVVIIFYDHINQLFDVKFSFGIGLSLAATVSWAFGSVYASKNKPSINILYSVGLQMLIAGICMLIICLISGEYINLFNAEHNALLSLLYLILFGSLITYSAYAFAISKLSPTQVSIYAYINPIVAIVLGWLLLNESLSINILLGALVTLVGIYLVNTDFKKQQLQQESSSIGDI